MIYETVSEFLYVFSENNYFCEDFSVSLEDFYYFNLKHLRSARSLNYPIPLRNWAVATKK